MHGILTAEKISNAAMANHPVFRKSTAAGLDRIFAQSFCQFQPADLQITHIQGNFLIILRSTLRIGSLNAVDIQNF